MSGRSFAIGNATVPPHQTSKERSEETRPEVFVATYCLVREGDANVAWHQADESSDALWSVEYGSFSEAEGLGRWADRLNQIAQIASIELRNQTSTYVVVLDDGTELSWSDFGRVSHDQTARKELVEFSKAERVSWWEVANQVLSSCNESRERANSTEEFDRLSAQVNRLFLAAQEERFETGMESTFSKRLQSIYAYNKGDLLRILKTHIYDGEDPEVISEMLAWVSRQERPLVGHEIVNVLVLGLHHGSPLVRDAAALGLSLFVGSRAIRYLRSAISREAVPELSADIEELVSSLVS